MFSIYQYYIIILAQLLRYNKMNSRFSNNIVSGFLEQDFLPQLNRAINHSRTERKIVNNMPNCISEKMFIGLLDSSIKNNNLSTNKYSEITQNQQNLPQKITHQVPKKKFNHKSKFKKNPQQSHQSKINDSIIYASPEKYKSELIKLEFIPEQQQNNQVKQIRILKERMKRFVKQTQDRKKMTDNTRMRERSFKKHMHHDCLDHTYDYETNLMAVNEYKLGNLISDSHQKSLLEILKSNLDNKIQQQNLQSRLRNIPQLNKSNTKSIQDQNIQKIQSKDRLLPENQKKFKPFQFHISNIDSLSKEIDKSISSGVKMITFQEKIIEEEDNNKQRKFTILKNEIIKENKQNKLQTQGSQSIIYSLGKNLNKDLQDDRKSYLYSPKSQMEKYYSIQYENLMQADHYKPIPSKKYLHQGDSSLQIRLPEINLFSKRSVTNNSRMSDQQMIKRLSNIQIKIRNKKDSVNITENKDRSTIFSAYEMKKQTQSSLQDGLFKSSKRSKTKKEYVKQYFNKYSQQFRHKITKTENINSLYA